MLTNHKGLAMTSSMPGKTLLINHFLINKEWYMVDLPGYGYAQRGKKQRDQLRRLIESYILKRVQLYNLFLLIDSRHAPQQIDMDFMRFLGENEIPFSIVFTKTDKLSNRQLTDNIRAYKEALLEEWEELPPVFLTSSEKKRGREELLVYIDEIIHCS